jgi:ethanolamine ammonia-lyase small subunit
MTDQSQLTPLSQLAAYRARTPARVLTGSAGSAYRTNTALSLRGDHAFARDAVQMELDLERDLRPETISRFGLFVVQTAAGGKAEYLRHPDLGRTLGDVAKREIVEQCPRGMDLQIAVGDGLSTTAVAAQVPGLLPLLIDGAKDRGWNTGRPFVIRYCRVGVLNDIGELLNPVVAVLLIGERPGLATSESLSAYLAYRPRAGNTDAQRNLISNIHARGIGTAEAARRIIDLAAQMMERKQSGIGIKERLQTPLLPVQVGEDLSSAGNSE